MTLRPPPVVQHNPQAPFGSHSLTKRLSPRGLPIPACNASPPGGGRGRDYSSQPATRPTAPLPAPSQPPRCTLGAVVRPDVGHARCLPLTAPGLTPARPPAPLRSALLPAPPGACPSRRRKPRRERGSRGGRERRDGGLQSQGGGARPPHEPAR